LAAAEIKINRNGLKERGLETWCVDTYADEPFVSYEKARENRRIIEEKRKDCIENREGEGHINK
jgi:hypothetical protein